MQHALVMTVLGQDRPGLVRSLADLVVEHGGNWLESRMSRLGGQFAGILRIEIPSEKEPLLVAALKRLELQGLTVVVHPDRQPLVGGAARLNVLEIVGQDRPGIVRQISQVLANHGVNVEELSTGCLSAAMSGETLFKASARLSIPLTCNISEMRCELEKIAEDLIVEVSLVDLPAKEEKRPNCACTGAGE
jgi:glycine cleavage system regulatory protein